MKIGGPEMGMTPMQMGNNAAPAPAAPAPAPNYRPADQIGRECLNCANYDSAQRMCNLHQFEAKPHYTCDDFTNGAEADPATAPMPPVEDPTMQG